jgi:hypothetical protein
MSCFLLPIDHIHCLVDLGSALEINTVYNEHNNMSHRLDYSTEDCQFIAQHPTETNKASVEARYHRDFSPATLYQRHPKQIPVTTVPELAQAIQWVRCYRYQACEALDWNATFANHYTQRLHEELVSRIVAKTQTSWVYDGAPR